MDIEILEEIEADVINHSSSTLTIFNAGEKLSVKVFDTQDEVWGVELPNGNLVYLPVESFRIQ